MMGSGQGEKLPGESDTIRAEQGQGRPALVSMTEQGAERLEVEVEGDKAPMSMEVGVRAGRHQMTRRQGDDECEKLACTGKATSGGSTHQCLKQNSESTLQSQLEQ